MTTFTASSFSCLDGGNGIGFALGTFGVKDVGEGGIDVSPGSTPQETIARATTIQAAALAPADPSGADLAVAANAQQMGQQAQAELAQEKYEPSKQKLIKVQTWFVHTVAALTQAAVR